MRESRKELVHLRLDPDVVRGVDACAMTWHTSRADAADRLIADGLGLHRAEIVAALTSVIERFTGPQTTASEYQRTSTDG